MSVRLSQEQNTDTVRDTNKTGHSSYAQFSNASQLTRWKNAVQSYQHFAFNLINYLLLRQTIKSDCSLNVYFTDHIMTDIRYVGYRPLGL
jgi:hypothetical protein